MSWNGVFMAEVQKHECLYNKRCREYRNRELRNDCWQKVADKFNISPMEAEKKFRNIRTAYGRFLKKRRTQPTQTKLSEFVPYAFENCEWLAVHIVHKCETYHDSSLNVSSRHFESSEDENSPITMSNMEFMNFGDYNEDVSPPTQVQEESENHEDANTSSDTKERGSKQQQIVIKKAALNNKHEISKQSHKFTPTNTKYDTQPALSDMQATTTQTLHAFIESQPSDSALVPRNLKRSYGDLEDEDDLYCRSLVPRLKRLSPQAKAYVRIQIEQLLFHAQYSQQPLQIGAPLRIQCSGESNNGVQLTNLLNGHALQQQGHT